VSQEGSSSSSSITSARFVSQLGRARPAVTIPRDGPKVPANAEVPECR
jgi:hypothetical protein